MPSLAAFTLGQLAHLPTSTYADPVYPLHLQDLSLEPKNKARLNAILDSIITGRPVRGDDQIVGTFNRIQIASSAGFLYSSKDDFALARAVLAIHPELKQVRTQLRVGRVGEPPPRRGRMPQGLWLVLLGARNHHMLPIRDWDAETEPIEASSDDRRTLTKALADAPLVQVEIFSNGQVCRMMRQVAVEVISEGPPVRFRIVHSDPSLNGLLQAIARRAEGRSR